MHCSGNRKSFRLRMVDNSRALSVCDDEMPSCRLGRRLWLLAYALGERCIYAFANPASMYLLAASSSSLKNFSSSSRIWMSGT